MARPKKDSNTPDAREALIEAFWKLLQDNQLHEISIGMIAAESGHNRGTFYYHFNDKEALVTAALERELRDIPRKVFMLASGLADDDFVQSLLDEHTMRIALFMEHGGRSNVESKVKDYIVNVWTVLLSPEGKGLTFETQIILEYMSSGMLGLLSSLSKLCGPDAVEFPLEFLTDYSDLALTQICRAQHISRDEILTRLQMLDQLDKVNRG